jgi:hypothetical protein
LLSVVLRPQSYSRSWVRALIAIGMAVGFLSFGSLSAMHAPPFMIFYLRWLVLIVVGLLVLFIWSTSASLWQRFHRRNDSRAQKSFRDPDSI